MPKNACGRILRMRHAANSAAARKLLILLSPCPAATPYTARVGFRPGITEPGPEHIYTLRNILIHSGKLIYSGTNLKHSGTYLKHSGTYFHIAQAWNQKWRSFRAMCGINWTPSGQGRASSRPSDDMRELLDHRTMCGIKLTIGQYAGLN
jgi:hypothetical protein